MPTPNPHAAFSALLANPKPALALAPMQDVTDMAFWRLMARYGGPDVFYTEYFRVHATYNLDKTILKAIDEHDTGKPIVAQLIGNDPTALVRAARDLQQRPVAAVDLNLGCPAPVVYKKCAGGGLLRDLPRVDAILGALRDAIPGRFTVKTRLGFDSTRDFESLLGIFARHGLDLLTVHGRTVLEGYRPGVHYEWIRRAVQRMPCPVWANGDVDSPTRAGEILQLTGAAGLMIGRGAIRNPWLFDQIRQHLDGHPVWRPRGQDLLAYVHQLFDSVCDSQVPERSQVERIKKHMNFVGTGLDDDGQFLHEIRRTITRADFFAVCTARLDHAEPLNLTANHMG